MHWSCSPCHAGAFISKGQRLAHQTSNALPSGGIAPLEVLGLTGEPADRLVLRRGHHPCIHHRLIRVQHGVLTISWTACRTVYPRRNEGQDVHAPFAHAGSPPPRPAVHCGGPGNSTYGGGGSCPGGRPAGAGSPAGPRDLTKWYIARRSAGVMCWSTNHGIGGRVWMVCAICTHCASETCCIYSRRLLAYVVPQGQRKPSVSPVNQCGSGMLPPA